MSGSPPLRPDDSERTVIRPSPGGRISVRAENIPIHIDTAASDPPSVQQVIMEVETSPIINTPLAAAATPLLQLLSPDERSAATGEESG